MAPPPTDSARPPPPHDRRASSSRPTPGFSAPAGAPAGPDVRPVGAVVRGAHAPAPHPGPPPAHERPRRPDHPLPQRPHPRRRPPRGRGPRRARGVPVGPPRRLRRAHRRRRGSASPPPSPCTSTTSARCSATVSPAEELTTLTDLLRRLRDAVNPDAARGVRDPQLICDDGASPHCVRLAADQSSDDGVDRRPQLLAGTRCPRRGRIDASWAASHVGLEAAPAEADDQRADEEDRHAGQDAPRAGRTRRRSRRRSGSTTEPGERPQAGRGRSRRSGPAAGITIEKSVP